MTQTIEQILEEIESKYPPRYITANPAHVDIPRLTAALRAADESLKYFETFQSVIQDALAYCNQEAHSNLANACGIAMLSKGGDVRETRAKMLDALMGDGK